MRKAVYTFIIGNYDTLKTPTVITGGWDYICFTDSTALRSNCWDVRPSIRNPADLGLEDKKFAMKHMILFDDYLGDYDVSLSIGGQVEINCNLNEFLAEHFKPENDMMICRHPERDWIRRLHPEQQRTGCFPQRDGEPKSNENADSQEQEGIEQDHTQDAHASGAEGHAYADFIGSPLHHVRHHTV